MGDGGWEGVMEGVRRGRRQTQGGRQGRGQVKDVNTNAKFLVIMMCDMSHVT